MTTLFLVCSKGGRECEDEFSTREEAQLDIDTHDYYNPVIIEEIDEEDDFEEEVNLYIQ